MKGLLLNLIVLCVVLPAFIAAFLLALASDRDAKAAICAVGVAEWLAVSLLVPTWTRRFGVGRAALCLVLFLAVSLAVSMAFAAGRTVGARVLAVQAYLFCYGAAIGGVAIFLSALTGRGWAGQGGAALVAAVLAANVLLSNVVMERLAALRNAMITVVLGTNPMAACGACMGYDVMRKGIMYEASRISYYNYAYPSWYVTAAVHLMTGAILIGLGRLLSETEAGEEG